MFKCIIILFTSLIFQQAIAQQKTVSLADLRLKGYKQEVLDPILNRSMTGDRMRVAGQRFDDGISVHAPFSAFLYVGKKAVSFTGAVGVDDGPKEFQNKGKLDSIVGVDGYKTFFYTNEATQERNLLGVAFKANEINPGSIEFIIYGDGKQLWSSGLMKRSDKAKAFSLDISTIEMLQLKVTDGGDNKGGDVADLGLLRVTTEVPGAVQFVAENYIGTIGRNTTAAMEAVMAKVKKYSVFTDDIAKTDWLLKMPDIKSSVTRTSDHQLVLSNGLVSRTIVIAPNAATASLKNLITGEEFIRAIEPEAIVKIDGETYDVGGLAGQVDRGYLLKEWITQMYSLPGSFQLTDIEVKNIEPRIQWKAKRWQPVTQWAQTGKELILAFTNPAKKGVIIKVHHKIYDGIPLLSKMITVENHSGKNILVNNFTSEIIAYPEKENFVSTPGSAGWSKPNFYIENDYAFGGMIYEESNQSMRWETDPAYTSQVNYSLQTPCIVKSGPKVGPAQLLSNGQDWQSINTFVMPLDGTNRERNTLSQRKMYRMLAPWSTENPIFLHLTSTNPEVVKEAVDQCVHTGYEMIILSFSCGLNMEDQSQANLDKFKQLADYAHSKGIQMGGYSLFSSRTINPETDVISIKTGKPGGANFGNAPCLGSQWGIDYLKKIKNFIDYTGIDLLEHDGPYPGDFCASTTHPGHQGYDDSQWKQWKQTTDFYQSLQAKDIYMNIPDFYILTGSNKTTVGYREVNWSLPRAQQIILGRQNLYDGTWTRTPSMGWSFVPLVQYHGGGAAATLEPLSEHLKEYAAHMDQNYGSGVQACYRGNRLYDTDATKDLVTQEISHYKKYRDILNADIIHLRRPTGRDWDGILHADPTLKQKGFAMLYNPLKTELTIKAKLPMYYTGIKGKAFLSIKGQSAKQYLVDKDGNIEVMVTIPAERNTWLVLEQGK
jgi:hypothetical protein